MAELIDTTDMDAQIMLGKIGIIAGDGNFPYLLIESMTKNNIPFVVAGLISFVKPEVKVLSIEKGKFIEAYLSDFTKIVRFFKKECVSNIVIIGGANKSAVKFNFYVLKMFVKLLFYKKKNDAIFRIIISEFEKKGFNVVGIQDAMPSLMSKPGLLTKIRPSSANIKDIEFALDKCREYGRTDIGQSIVVKDGCIIGKESELGTDVLIEQVLAAKNGEKGGVMIKLAKEGQEERCDIPAIGFRTIQQLIDAKIDGIVIESGYKTIIEKKEKLSEFASQNNIFIMVV